METLFARVFWRDLVPNLDSASTGWQAVHAAAQAVLWYEINEPAESPVAGRFAEWRMWINLNGSALAAEYDARRDADAAERDAF